MVHLTFTESSVGGHTKPPERLGNEVFVNIQEEGKNIDFDEQL